MAGSVYRVSFFFNDTATTEIYTLSLHDALPISHAPDQRDGARGDSGQERSRHRRRLRGQDDRHRSACPGEGGGGRGERARVRPPAAQLQVGGVPERPGQRERHGGQVHHRHDRHGRGRVHPEDGGPRAAQPRRRGRHAPLHAVVAGQQAARLPARLPRRGLGRRPHAVLRVHGRYSSLPAGRRLREAAQGRLPALLRRHDRILRSRRDDPERRQLLRNRPPHRGPLGHYRAALPLEVVGPRVQAGEAHAGDVPGTHCRNGGTGVLAHARRRARLRHRGGRDHHPRARRDTHGGRRQDLGAPPLVPGARLQEPVRDRRRAVRVAGRQETHLDYPGAVAADERIHRGPNEEGSALMQRRDAVQVLAVAPLAAAFRWAPESVREASALARTAVARGAPYEPKHFTAHEWETVRLLVDLISPHDERSGSATDAGVPEFIDFMVGDDADLETPIRGGLAWLDHECDNRYGKTLVASSDTDRTALLDDIAWPKKAKREHSAGVAFFNSFRDLTASGFFSSKLGVQDLRYIGNTFVSDWKGCPPEALAKLGVTYGE